MSGAFKSLRNQNEEMELRWFAGWFSSKEGRQARYFLRGLQTKKTEMRIVAMGAMPALPIGVVISTNGMILDTRAEGIAIELEFDDLSRCENIPFDGHVPRFVYSLDGHRGWDQRILRYSVGKTTCLIPAYELIRYFFCLNRALTDALLAPAGLTALAICPPPGIYDETEISFTEELPARLISQPFVQEFAWLSIDPEARRSWDSVWELSSGQRFLSVRPPAINGTMVVRGTRHAHIIFVHEIVNFRGRRHPCGLLEYSHPSLSNLDNAEPLRFDNSDHPKQRVPPYEGTKEIEDGSSPRWNSSLSATNIGRQYSAFVNDVRVTRRRPFRSTDGADGVQLEPMGSILDSDVEHPPAPFTPMIDRNLEPRPRQSRYSLNPSNEYGKLQPLELTVLPQTVVEYSGETRALAEVINLIAMVSPNMAVSMSFCFLKPGRKFSITDRGRRACLIALFRRENSFPVVLLDVDHAGITGLAGLLIGFKRDFTLTEIEYHIEVILDALVDRGGKWDKRIEHAMVDIANFQRLPWVARRQGIRQGSEFRRDWARKIIVKLRGLYADGIR